MPSSSFLTPAGSLQPRSARAAVTLGRVGLGHLVVVILGEGGGAAEGEHESGGKSFHHGKVLQRRVTYEDKLPSNSFRYLMDINTACLEMIWILLGTVAE